MTNSATNSTQTGFVYDGKMRRRIRTEAKWGGTDWVTNHIVRYLYDGNRVLQERDGSNNVLVTYTRGLDLGGSLEGAGGIGGLLALTHPGTPSDHHFYYHSDGNGNVTAIMNQNQTLVAQYHYDPFGNLIAQSGPLAEGNLYRFSSKEFHQASGLYYYGYRFYDPNLQRWLNRDPIGEAGGINLYRFVRNNPINRSDPFGLNDFVGAYLDAMDSQAMDDYAVDTAMGDGYAAQQSQQFQALANAGGKIQDNVASTGVAVGVAAATTLETGNVVAGVANGVSTFFPMPDFTYEDSFGGVIRICPLSGGVRSAANGGGRLGNASTRQLNSEIAGKLEQHGQEITGGGGRAPETFIPGAGPGTKGGNFTDITSVRDGQVLHVTQSAH